MCVKKEYTRKTIGFGFNSSLKQKFKYDTVILSETLEGIERTKALAPFL